MSAYNQVSKCLSLYRNGYLDRTFVSRANTINLQNTADFNFKLIILTKHRTIKLCTNMSKTV